MKKLLALLLAAVMIFAAGCGGGAPAPKDETPSAIKPVENEEKVTLYDRTMSQSLTLTRVTTDSRKDASELYMIIREYLDKLGVTAEIKSLYTIPFGLANNYSECIPVKVYFEDEGVKPIYVDIFKDDTRYTPGLSAIGHYRDEDVVNDEYLTKTTDVLYAWIDKLQESLGFLDSKHDVHFIITCLRDLPLATPSESEKKLFEYTADRYFHYMLASWPELGEATTIDGQYYQILNRDDIKSVDDLRTYLAGAFTERILLEIQTARPELEMGDHPVYYEKDGALYVAPMGQGGPEDLAGVEVKYSAQNDNYLFLILEATRVVRNWDTWEVEYSFYEEYMIVYEKTGDSWLCDFYVDIPFGYYESLM